MTQWLGWEAYKESVLVEDKPTISGWGTPVQEEPLINIKTVSTTPTATPTPTNGGTMCSGCGGAPASSTPVYTPPATSIGGGGSSTAGKTYSQLAAGSGAGAPSTTGDSPMTGSDLWKYLVGAAIGYFLAKR